MQVSPVFIVVKTILLMGQFPIGENIVLSKASHKDIHSIELRDLLIAVLHKPRLRGQLAEAFLLIWLDFSILCAFKHAYLSKCKYMSCGGAILLF